MRRLHFTQFSVVLVITFTQKVKSPSVSLSSKTPGTEELGQRLVHMPPARQLERTLPIDLTRQELDV